MSSPVRSPELGMGRARRGDYIRQGTTRKGYNAMANGEATNVARVDLFFLQDGQRVMNTHHFYDGTGWDAGKLNNLAEGVYQWWHNDVRGQVSNTVQLTGVIATDLTPGSGLQAAKTTGLPEFGGKNSPALPNNVTLAVKKATGFAGRSFHGRTFFIGLTEDAVTGNTVDPTLVGTLVTAFDHLKEPLGPLIPVDLCVLSLVADGVERPDGICTPVTGISVDSTVDSQRRRLPGRGR